MEKLDCKRLATAALITLTDTAAERVVGFLANRGSGLGIRLSVQTTGCSSLMAALIASSAKTEQ
jgi:Fe-S cluster assembly iron-binding protein IscA